MRTKQVLTVRVKVELGVIAVKGEVYIPQISRNGASLSDAV